MLNLSPYTINAVVIGQNRTGFLSNQIMPSSDIQTRIVFHQNTPCDLLNFKDLENCIIVGAFSDVQDDDLKQTLRDFEAETLDGQTVIIEKKFQSFLSQNLSDLQKSYLFSVPRLRHETLFETVILAYEHSRQILDLQRDIRSRQSAIGLIRSGVFEVKTPKEARNLATMLGLLCPNPELTGTGLFELIMNAIEHGNLGIDYEMKLKLIRQGTLSKEILTRLDTAPYRHKVVQVRFQERADSYLFQIYDQGAGFDIRKIQKYSHNLFSGRGIHIARTLCFDRLQYRKGGTLAIATLIKK